MNISSTPFIRNDYWPDYNDINELNKRIDETENEISLVNIRLSADIENVSNNLNSYINNQANTIISNNIIVNNLNANYATGKFANFVNTNTDNAYVENLTVNKPVFDITLNTPHIENVTSLGGNIFNVNITDVNLFNVNVDFSNHSGNFNNLHINTANIGNLFVNIDPAPVTSSAVLGYDSEGRVIPIHATYDASFPEDADYLFTDQHGTAFAGTAATAVGETDNLITSFAVKNALNIVNESFNSVNNALNDIDSWQNTFENSVANSFNSVNNALNDIDSWQNTFENSVANSFNDVNNTFNNVNNVISDVNNTSVNAATLAGSVLSSLVGNAIPYNSTSIVDYRSVEHIEFVTPASEGYVSQLTIVLPPKTQTIEISNNEAYRVTDSDNRTIQFIGNSNHTFTPTTDSIYIQKRVLDPKGNPNWGTSLAYAPSISGNDLILIATNGNTVRIPLNSSLLDLSRTYVRPNISLNNTPVPVFIDFNSTTNTLIYSSDIAIDNSYSRVYNEDMRNIFSECTRFNQSINIPDYAICAGHMFSNCTNFNKPINIPGNITDVGDMFSNCTKFNQPINIPASVTDMRNMLADCTSFNQNDIYIHAKFNDAPSMYGSFRNTSRIGNVHIPASVPKDTSNDMYNCIVNGYTGKTFAAANINNDL